MKIFKLMMLALSVVVLVSMGAYGCTKKQVKTEEGRVEAQKPTAPEPVREEAPAPKDDQATRDAKVAEAPPGPKEDVPPVEAPKPEKHLDDVYFDFDMFDIRPGDAEILQSNYEWIKQNPGLLVVIEGHCDERGTVEYNLALGERRAESAKNYLVSLGADRSKLKTISYGKSKPADPGHDEEAWAKNRRAHFVVQ